MIFYFESDWQKGHVLATDLNEIKLFVYMHGDDAVLVDLDGNGYEFEPGIDDKILDNVYVKDGDKYVDLRDAIRQAEMQYLEIRDDLEREAIGDSEHAREVSSPYLSGRV